jgi:hypothetical protein
MNALKILIRSTTMNSKIRKVLAVALLSIGVANVLPAGAFSHPSSKSIAIAYPGGGPVVAIAYPGGGPVGAIAYPGGGPVTV